MTELNRPAIYWAKPAPPHPQLQRALTISDQYDDQPVKEISIFDEIFPAKKSLVNEEREENWLENNTFHKAIGPLLIVGQCFGVLPVSGLLGPDESSLKFTWRSWRVAYTFIIMAVTAVMFTFCISRIIDEGIDIYKTVSLMFFSSALTSLILFLRLAPRWPSLCKAMALGEQNQHPISYPQFQSPKTKTSLKKRFSICCFGVLFFALVEHVLSVIAGIAVAHDCPQGTPPIQSYFVNAYPHVFYFTNFSLAKAFFLQPINFSATFNWNFMDLFIIVMSIALTDKFELLGDRLDAITGKHLSENFWRTARIEFANLAQLVRKVDDHINKIVLLSFANNLYFICLQLFNSLKPFRAITHVVYFTFSFSFLMMRSLVVSLGAARIHTAAKRPAVTLYSVPSESYCVEVRRFLEQVTSDVVALTGLNFFYVTRGLVLTIAGTIVTYELVLVQFNAPPAPVTANLTISGIENNCSILNATS